MAVEGKKKIYCFNNGPGFAGCLSAVAIAEDGNVLAQHACSNESFMAHDLGLTSDWKHENYNEHYGEGNWDLVWIEAAANDPRLDAALRLNSGMEAPT